MTKKSQIFCLRKKLNLKEKLICIKNVQLMDWEKERLKGGLEILFIKDTQLSIGQQPTE